MTKEKASLAFKALGDPNRLKIIKLLINNDEICACDLLRVVDCKQATLSHHLHSLKQASLLISYKNGKNVIYKANMELLKEISLYMLDECQECRKIDK